MAIKIAFDECKGWKSCEGLVYSRPTARVVELVDTTDSKGKGLLIFSFESVR